MGCISMPKGAPNKRYIGEFKQLVVETMIQDKLSYREVAQQFNISAHEQVDYIDYYNNRRIKARLKGLPPASHRQQALLAA